MAKDSTKRRPRANAADAKPYPEFPLTPHPSGRWRKVYKGKAHYFGPLDDWQKAQERFEHEWPYITTGRPIPPREGEAPAKGIITVEDVVNDYLVAKRELLDNGELSPRTFADHIRTGKFILAAIDRNRDIETIGPDDFAALRKKLAVGRKGRRRSLLTLGILITRCRSVFTFAVNVGHRKSALLYGVSFDKPTARAMEISDKDKPKKRYTAAQCRSLIDAAPVQLKAMLLLALNAGMGNTDVAGLRMAHLDLNARVVEMPRQKTGRSRRAVLWPQTCKAIRAAMAERPTPTREAEGLVFVTQHGNAWVRDRIIDEEETGGRAGARLSQTDAITGAFTKTAKSAKVPNLGFYAVRHTFRRAVDDLADRPAIDRVMGHKPTDIRTHYVDPEDITDKRLKAVSDHVRRWLMKGKKGGKAK